MTIFVYTKYRFLNQLFFSSNKDAKVIRYDKIFEVRISSVKSLSGKYSIVDILCNDHKKLLVKCLKSEFENNKDYPSDKFYFIEINKKTQLVIIYTEGKKIGIILKQ